MRKLSILGALCAILLLGGCAAMGSQGAQQVQKYGINATLLSSEVITIAPRIKTGENVIAQHASAFTPAQQQKLLTAKHAIGKALTTVHSIVTGAGGAAQVLVSLSQVEMVYSNAKTAYEQARPVLKAHWSVFTPLQQQELNTVDAQAQAIDQSMQALMSTPNPKAAQVQAMLFNALQLAAAGAKIAIAVGG